MLNTVYQLTAPRRINLEIVDEKVREGSVIVRPQLLSICHADQRYFQGSRPAEVLEEKLPMALIHEGLGEVVFDGSKSFVPGETVVFIPNLPQENDEIIAENYLRSSKFRGSNTDGLMQELIVTSPDRLVRLPEGIDRYVASFTELVSVSFHAIERFMRFSHSRKQVIGVWGDGNLGFITSLLIKRMMPDSKVVVFGKNEFKLLDFTFVDDAFVISQVPDELKLDHAFECVGGVGSASAVDQIINMIQPEGSISLMGVSEDSIPLNSRLVLEKGLRLFGSSRSGREDFIAVIDCFLKDPAIVSYLQQIVGQVIEVSSIGDINDAFEIDMKKSSGKTIMRWRV